MLAKRIIPTLLCRGRTLVKGQRFNAWRSVGVAEQAVRIHQAREVDELVLLDICATAENRGPDLKLVEQLAESCFMPLAVGGGVRNLQHVRDLLKAGADKIVMGTHAFKDPYQVVKIAEAVGSQALVLSIDVKDGVVWTHCATERTRVDPVRYAGLMEKMGVGEILVTAIDREGTLEGYDLELIRKVAEAVSIPVIANGGAGSYAHMQDAIEAGADGVAAGAMFQFTEQTPLGAAEYLQAQGVEVRTREGARP